MVLKCHEIWTTFPEYLPQIYLKKRSHITLLKIDAYEIEFSLKI